MRVLLVQQELGKREVKYPLFPIGLTYIATALKKHKVKIFDPNYYDLPDSYEKLKAEVEQFKPDIVGISIRNIDTTRRRDPFIHLSTLRPTLQIIKAVNSEIKIIAGGSGFSFFAKEIMERFAEIDFGIFLEGEESTPELLDNLAAAEKVKGLFIRQNGQVHFTGERPLPDFAKLPIPRKDAEIIDMSKYRGPLHNIVGIQSKRGCVFKCIYCSYLFLNEEKLRLRNPMEVVDEIESLVNDYNIRLFAFVDSIFNIPQEHAVAICKEIIKRKLDIEWGAWCDLKTFSAEFLALAKEAGCRHVGFSPDAATDKGLAILKKGITEKDIERSFRIARKVKGVAMGYNFFCCYPGQDLKGFIKTLILMFKIPLVLPGRGGVGIYWIRIEPHTEIYQTAIEEKILDKNTNLLPETNEELLKLFYTPASQRYATVTMDLVIALVKNVLEPVVKAFFRFMYRLKGKNPLYDI